MSSEVTWWGVVTCSSWVPIGDRRRRLAELESRAEAAEILAGKESGDEEAPPKLTLRWSAPDDLAAALIVVEQAAGAEPGDFEPGHPQRV
jgi:hypothetical protein